MTTTATPTAPPATHPDNAVEPPPFAPPIILVERATKPPRPVFRQTTTIVPPSDNYSGLTFEMIVLFDSPHKDDETASQHDLPELQQAGWACHGYGQLSVYSRVLGLG